MEYIDFFCGGGGSSRGYHQAGLKSLAAFDLEKSCVRTYNTNFGKIAYRMDVSEIRSETITRLIGGQKPHLVTASPPCEPFTIANATRIKNPFERLFDDKYGRLTINTLRLIQDLGPEFFTIENVVGILDGDGKSLLREMINDIGYTPHFQIINASDFGLPSERIRVFITNFKINSPKLRPVSVQKAIDSLPAPNYPHEFTDHVTLPISEAYERKLPQVQCGESIMMFKGAKTDMKNYMRIFNEFPAPVVMGKSRFIHPFEDRILTPREHARLMGFPDKHKFIGGWEKIYDMIGEAVPPPITREIGKQIGQLL